MKTRIIFALVSFVSLTLCSVSLAETDQQQADRLLQLLDSDLNLKAQNQAIAEIRDGPRMGRLFMPKLQAILNGQSSEALQPVLRALREVRDLPESDVSFLYQKTAWGISNILNDVPHAGLLANHGPLILANYPSTDHERLVITLLDKQHDRRSALQEMAVQALKQSGSRMALEAMRSLADRIKPKEGEVNSLCNLIVETLPILQARQSVSVSDTPPNDKPPAPNPIKAKLESDVLNKREISSPPWTIIVAMIFAATGLLWLLLKRRS